MYAHMYVRMLHTTSTRLFVCRSLALSICLPCCQLSAALAGDRSWALSWRRVVRYPHLIHIYTQILFDLRALSLLVFLFDRWTQTLFAKFSSQHKIDSTTPVHPLRKEFSLVLFYTVWVPADLVAPLPLRSAGERSLDLTKRDLTRLLRLCLVSIPCSTHTHGYL